MEKEDSLVKNPLDPREIGKRLVFYGIALNRVHPNKGAKPILGSQLMKL